MERVAIVGGARTPFVKAGGAFAGKTTLDLLVHVVKATAEKLSYKPQGDDELILSTVLLDPRYPNLSREVALKSGLSSLNAHFISNNCISGLVAATFGADGIKTGRMSAALVGGAESMSCPTLTFPRKGEQFFLNLSRARSAAERVKLLLSFRPRFVVPQPPSPKEPSTGLTMGQHCEISAKEFSISRDAQDAVALKSHQNAAAAAEKGYLAEEIAPFAGVEKDNLVRKDTSKEKLAKLGPVFDRGPQGTITAGNASALTDGGSAVLFLREEDLWEQVLDIYSTPFPTQAYSQEPALQMLHESRIYRCPKL